MVISYTDIYNLLTLIIQVQLSIADAHHKEGCSIWILGLFITHITAAQGSSHIHKINQPVKLLNSNVIELSNGSKCL